MGVETNGVSGSNGYHPDYLAIHETFARTEYGQNLAAAVRWGIFKPDGVTNERWIELLGPDVDNLAHMPDTLALTQRWNGHTKRLAPGSLSAFGEVLLCTGATTHDWTESITTDINFHYKTEADDELEERLFYENLENFYPGGDPATTELIRQAAAEVVFNRTSYLGRMFNAVERIGYLRTGLRAHEHVAAGSAEECDSHFRWLGASALCGYHTSNLLVVSHHFPAARHFLQGKKQAISEAFAAADPEIFSEHLPAETAALRRAALKDNRQLWEAWTA